MQENAIVERYNKEINPYLRPLTYDNPSLTNYKKSLPFVQRTLISNHSDRLKISAAQMLFGNMLNLDRGIFLPLEERPVSIEASSLYASEMLAMQTNLPEKSAVEVTYYICQLSSLVPQRLLAGIFRTGAPPSRLYMYSRGPTRFVYGENSHHTPFDLITIEEKDYHISDMKPFIFNADPVDPVDVARRDYIEFLSLKM